MSRESQAEMAFAKQQNSASPLAASGAPSTPQPLHHDQPPPPSNAISASKLRTMELSLRIIVFITSVAAFVFLVTDRQSKSFTLYTVTLVQEARFSDVEAVIYGVIVVGVVAVYSILQLIKVLLIEYHSLVPESALSWAFFLCDQVMAYLILSASAALTQAAWFSKKGNEGLGWMMVCDVYAKFCKQIGLGLVATFAAFIAMVLTSGISAFNLFAIGSTS